MLFDFLKMPWLFHLEEPWNLSPNFGFDQTWQLRDVAEVSGAMVIVTCLQPFKKCGFLVLFSEFSRVFPSPPPPPPVGITLPQSVVKCNWDVFTIYVAVKAYHLYLILRFWGGKVSCHHKPKGSKHEWLGRGHWGLLYMKGLVTSYRSFRVVSFHVLGWTHS